MKYKIFELIPNTRYEPDGYYTKSITNYTLEELDGYTTFNSAEDAHAYIRDNSSKHTSSKLIILPVYDIDWEGKIKE